LKLSLPGKDWKLTFDEFCREKFESPFEGSEVVGMFMVLSGKEDTLDPFQRSALERLRSILYEALSIDDLECMQTIYKKHIADTCGQCH
jgi:hypothetical protein